MSARSRRSSTQKEIKKPASEEARAYSFSTAFGLMAIAWRGDKIIGTQLPEADLDKLLTSLKKRLNLPHLSWCESEDAPAFVKETAQRITRHLGGDAQKFPLDRLALDQISPFFLKVYSEANRIPSGEVRTYSEIAMAAGSPLASRAVGQAMARNPFHLLVPCHRVVGTARKMVGFTAHGGVETKASLLEMESLA